MNRIGKTLREYFCLCGSGKQEKKVFNVLLLGLTNSGKTELGYVILGEPRKDYTVTNGARKFSKSFNNFKVNFTEIGGSYDMQRIWHHYFVKTMAIIYTVDISDTLNLPIAFQILETIATHQFIKGKSILIIATKSDLSDNIEVQDLEQCYNLEQLANQNKCPMSIRDCQLDDYNQLYKGLNWLYNILDNDYEKLRIRISYETRIAKFEKIPAKKLHISKSTQTLKKQNSQRPLTAPARSNKISLLQIRDKKSIRLRRIFASDTNSKRNFVIANEDDDNLDNIKVNPSTNKLNLGKDSVDESSKIEIENNNNDSGDGDKISSCNLPSSSSTLNGFKKFRNNRVDGVDVNEIISIPENQY